jgi:hypothetical protein
MKIEFPDAAEDALKRLCELHPGLKPSQVVARAMTCYHVLYEAHLEGDSCPHVQSVMEHLDKEDDKYKED